MLLKKKNNIKEGLQAKLKKLLIKKRNACYILITCTEPSDDGKMQVELTYEGDKGLAAYLIDNAQSFFEQDIPE
ncbi:MAG: hypothetical protein P4L16_04180 [Chlamydiales bacterium]|nr:hypothetical protein [Chlamydiales bacterium]